MHLYTIMKNRHVLCYTLMHTRQLLYAYQASSSYLLTYLLTYLLAHVIHILTDGYYLDAIVRSELQLLFDGNVVSGPDNIRPGTQHSALDDRLSTSSTAPRFIVLPLYDRRLPMDNTRSACDAGRLERRNDAASSSARRRSDAMRSLVDTRSSFHRLSSVHVRQFDARPTVLLMLCMMGTSSSMVLSVDAAAAVRRLDPWQTSCASVPAAGNDDRDAVNFRSGAARHYCVHLGEGGGKSAAFGFVLHHVCDSHHVSESN